MRYLYILTIILATSIYANGYNKIELSEAKKELSYEIFKKLEKEHGNKIKFSRLKIA